MRRRAAARGAALLVLVAAPPLLGAWMAGRPLGPLLAFPPVPAPAQAPPFSWPVFLALAALIAAALVPLASVLHRAWRTRAPPGLAARPARFPLWGWVGIGLLALGWTLAWTRIPWLDALQRHTFTPLWLAYIVVVNALTLRRSGQCLLTQRPGYLLALFPLSAAFWWLFEWLNRFVENWHYVGIEGFSAAEYVLFASISFSTVLPAVMSTLDWLESFPSLAGACVHLGRPRRAPSRRAGAGLSLALAVLGGGALAAWPDVVFPLVWVAPLFAVLGVQQALGEETALAPLTAGDWRPVILPALAALICGFFWELWNFRSLAHWVYSVPYVQRFHLFEMPVLGYAGYLPFGLQCAAAAGLLGPWRWRAAAYP